MIRRAASLSLPDTHFGVLELLCEKLPLTKVNWALTGSVGHRLQGVDVPVHDVDVQTDNQGASAAAQALAEFVVEPPRRRESELILSIFGTFVIDGVLVELMGGIRKRTSAGAAWGLTTDPAEHRLVVNYGGLAIPVLGLSYEAAAYEALGRRDRAAQLRRAEAARTRDEQGSESWQNTTASTGDSTSTAATS